MWPFRRRPDVARLVEKRDVAGLIAALEHGERAVAEAALVALVRLEAPGVEAALLAALEAGSAAAARALAARGCEGAAPALAAALGADDPVLAQEARAALVRLKDSDTLIQALREDPRPAARGLALRGLAELRPPTLGRLLEQALSDPAPENRRLADALGAVPRLEAPGARSVEALAALGRAGPEALPEVVAALAGPDPRARLAALEAARALLAMHPDAAAAALQGPLLQAAQAPDASTRLAATRALGLLGPAAQAPLLALLGDPEPLVRQAAAEALGARGEADAVPALRAALREGEWAAARALARLGAREALPDLLAALEDPRAAGVAAEALGSLDLKEAIPALEAFVAGFRASPHPPGEPDDGDVAAAALARLRG